MNRILIDNWNQCVDAEDQVFFLGDFGLGDVEHLHSICSQVKSHKICIRGNHDPNASYMMRVVNWQQATLSHLKSTWAKRDFPLYGGCCQLL